MKHTKNTSVKPKFKLGDKIWMIGSRYHLGEYFLSEAVEIIRVIITTETTYKKRSNRVYSKTSIVYQADSKEGKQITKHYINEKGIDSSDDLDREIMYGPIYFSSRKNAIEELREFKKKARGKKKDKKVKKDGKEKKEAIRLAKKFKLI